MAYHGYGQTAKKIAPWRDMGLCPVVRPTSKRWSNCGPEMEEVAHTYGDSQSVKKMKMKIDEAANTDDDAAETDQEIVVFDGSLLF